MIQTKSICIHNLYLLLLPTDLLILDAPPHLWGQTEILWWCLWNCQLTSAQEHPGVVMRYIYLRHSEPSALCQSCRPKVDLYIELTLPLLDLEKLVLIIMILLTSFKIVYCGIRDSSLISVFYHASHPLHRASNVVWQWAKLYFEPAFWSIGSTYSILVNVWVAWGYEYANLTDNIMPLPCWQPLFNYSLYSWCKFNSLTLVISWFTLI